MSINKSTLHVCVRWLTHIFIGISSGFLSSCWRFPYHAKCCLSVTGWHLAERNVKFDLSVVTLDCLVTFVSINCRVLFKLIVTHCWQGCKKFISCLLWAWPGRGQTCIDCDRLSLLRQCDTDISLWMSKDRLSDTGRWSWIFRLCPSLSFSLLPLSCPCLPFCQHLTTSKSVDLTHGTPSQIKVGELFH